MRYYEKVDEVAGDYQYEISQYESHRGGKFGYRECIEARYIDLTNPNHKGNPLVEALPPSRNTKAISKSIQNLIPYSPDEKNGNDEDRIDGVMRLNEVFFPLSNHISVVQTLDSFMKSSLAKAKMPTEKILEDLGIKSEQLQYLNNEIVDDVLQIDSVIKEEFLSASEGFMLIGPSGSGKTNTLKRALENYPKMMIHREYRGERILFKQVPWIKIEGAHTNSLSGIGKGFAKQLDDVLGTDYHKAFVKRGVTNFDHIDMMAKLVNTHGVGVLIFDEIQYIAKDKKKDVVNYLNKLHNTLGVAIVYIGTYSIYNWMSNTMPTLKRRMEGKEKFEWNLMEYDHEFHMFMKRLWNYQWIQNPPELTEEMVDAFYQNTMGLVERVVRVFQKCQMNAINLGTESFAPTDVAKVSKSFPFTHDIIRAIREKDYDALDKLDGMMKIDLKDEVQNIKKSIREREEHKQMLTGVEMANEFDDDLLKSDLLASVIPFGVNPDSVKKKINSLVKKRGKKAVATLKMELMNFVINGEKDKRQKQEETVRKSDKFEEIPDQREKVVLNGI